MATAYIIVTIAATIISLAITTGVNTSQMVLNYKNSSIKNAIQSLIGKFRSEISSGRLSTSKMISLLQAKNNSALMTYLQNNPVITRSIQDIQKDSELIAGLQAEANSLEADLAALQNEMNSLGYSSSHTGNYKEEKKLKELKSEYAAKASQYKNITDKAKNMHVGGTTDITTVTSDLDARSQNINGGVQ